MLAVARYGSFTAAAKRSYMVQSTLSRQVAALERELGGELFVRGPRSVHLTARGKAFMPYGAAVLEAASQATQAARSA